MVADPASENTEFRRYLKARNIASHETLVTIGRQVSERFECRSCANCCREVEVNPDERDIERLAQHLDTSRDEIQRLYTEPDHSSASGFKLKQPGGACIFLHENECLVYDGRPRACRDFPYVGRPENALGARMSSLCRSAAFCPIVQQTLEQYKRVTGFHPHAARGAGG